MSAAVHEVVGKSDVVGLLTTPSWPPANRFRDLLEVGCEAVRLKPSEYFRSVFGSPGNWLPPYRRFSEYNIINPWHLMTTNSTWWRDLEFFRHFAVARKGLSR